MNFFIFDTTNVLTIAYSYSWPLVVLSIALASVGSGLAIYLSHLLPTIDTKSTRRAVRLAGAVAFGGAVWSMHFVGMLAFKLCVNVTYDPEITVLSSLPAMFAAWLAMAYLGKKSLTFFELGFASVMIGGGIGIMHYSGMYAMHMTAQLLFDPLTFALSIALAFALSMASLIMMAYLNKGSSQLTQRSTIIGGMGFGAAISAMHYMGMYAARFVGVSETEHPIFASDYLYLAVLVLITSMSILSVVFSGSLLTRVRQQHTKLESVYQDYTYLLNSVNLGIISIDRNGQMDFSNRGALEVLEQSSELLTRIRELLAQGTSENELTEISIKKNRDTQLHFLVSATRHFGPNEQDLGYWVVITDVTDIRLHEQHLIHSAKLATLGEMSTGMAHEINQPLNVIRLALQNLKYLLSKDSISKDRVTGKIDTINTQVDRAARLVSHMRTYGRVASTDFEPFDLREALQQSEDIWSEQLRLESITLTVEYNHDSPMIVNGCLVQFEQVMINMINNAKDAIRSFRSAGHIGIKVTEQPESYTILVQDDGGGIPDDALPNIFVPFFTTKPVGEGTGLGCSISYGIISDMGGELEVRNCGGGACFTITIPKYSGEEVAEAEAEAAQAS